MRSVICLLTASLLIGSCSGSSGGGIKADGGGGGGTTGTGGGGGGTGGGAAGGSGGVADAGPGGSGGADAGGAGAGGDALADTPGIDATTDDGPAGDAVAAAGQVTPTLRNGRWLFEAAGISFEVDPRVGGRVTGYGFGATNLLTAATVNAENWGSTFWTSPQADWDWPPPPQIDNQPYTVDSSANALVLTGPQSPAIGVSVTKTFTMERADGTVRLTYRVTNRRPTAVTVAPWEVTRVANRGLVFFPTGPTIQLLPGATLPTTEAASVTWFAYNAADIRADSKLYADALEGWLAYADQDLVFIKKFPDVPAAMLAPMHGDVEIYTNRLRSYIELENQGAYTPLAPQADLTWTVTWYLKRLPEGVTPTAGNAALVDFVRATIR